MRLADLFRRRRPADADIPQTEPLPGMVANSAGGFSFAIDDWARLDRFLILGSEAGSYYASAPVLTRENAEGVLRCLAADGPRAVARIVAISDSGRAPRNDAAIFALALAASAESVETRRAALAALPRVCRTGTHLFQFAVAIESQRGWGRALRRAVGDWYLGRDVDELAFQAVKYRQRGGWSHRDMLRLAHPRTDDAARRALFEWICRGTPDPALPAIVQAYLAAATAKAAEQVTDLILTRNLPREALPTHWLNHVDVWAALLERMPAHALVRNLAKMTEVGLLAPLSDAALTVSRRLADHAALRRARLHPMAVLIAQRTYATGKGQRGSLVWAPVAQVTDALNDAFYGTFEVVQPTGKRLYLAVDVSGSMTFGHIAGTALTPRDAAAAMALVTARTEASWYVMGFAAANGKVGDMRTGMVPLTVTPAMRLDDVIRSMAVVPFGATDCALPMLDALERGLKVDAFVVYTDSETFHGKVHPVEALRRYRKKTGIPAKLVVVGMVANKISIADPADAGMLDVVGFDAAAPAIIADFIRG
ncbi:TROVE domain-containing protein [Zavarzinia sp. CC-PAN008]|uniref:TROVE domain-containing protein n=1 Tax=Zavarzinia sp. CC-PAN008 TaxID=3243332 RepID=UPI003F7457E4